MDRVVVAVVAALALSVTGACGPVTVSKPPAQTLAQSIDAQVARHEAITWTARRQLV